YCSCSPHHTHSLHDALPIYATEEKPRFVLGSVGPGTKLPTLGHIEFATLRDAYLENMLGLIEGGVDAILIETSQDLLQTKAAVRSEEHTSELQSRFDLVCRL